MSAPGTKDSMLQKPSFDGDSAESRFYRPGVVKFLTEEHRQQNANAHQMLDYGLLKHDFASLSHAIGGFEDLLEKDPLLRNDLSVMGKLARGTFLYSRMLSYSTQLPQHLFELMPRMWKKAFDYSSTYVSLDSDNAYKTVWAAIAAYSLGDYETALTYFEWYFSLDNIAEPYHMEAYQYAIHSAAMIRDYDTVCMYVEKLQALNPNYSGSLLYQGYLAALQSGRNEEAFQCLYDYAAALKNNSYDALIELVYFSLDMGSGLFEVYALVSQKILSKVHTGSDTDSLEVLLVAVIDLTEALGRTDLTQLHSTQLKEINPDHYRLAYGQSEKS